MKVYTSYEIICFQTWTVWQLENIDNFLLYEFNICPIFWLNCSNTKSKCSYQIFLLKRNIIYNLKSLCVIFYF